MSNKTVMCVVVTVVGLCSAALVRAQPNFKFTKIVDLNGSPDANFTSIRAAIDNVPDNTSDHYTILVYAGTYTIDSVAKLVELDDKKENVDIVGIDRESVIIDVTIGDATTPRAGIKITSGTETSRNNRIANLTIKTTHGHGIKIVKGGTPVPRNITIEGVTIDANGSGMEGISGADAEDVRIVNCDVTSDMGNGIVVGNRWNLTRVSVETPADATFIHSAVVIINRDFVTIVDCEIVGENQAIFLANAAKDVLVQGCRLSSPGAGGPFSGTVMMHPNCKRVLFQGCVIVSDATGTTRLGPQAVFVDGNSGPDFEDVVFQSCRISAIGGEDSTSATAVKLDVGGALRVVDCEISATNVEDPSDAGASASAVGVGSGVIVIGGSIVTSSGKKKETEVWDMLGGSGPSSAATSGTRLSKWKGPIKSAGRQRSVVQRTINVGLASVTAILSAKALTAVEQPNVLPENQPDVYRVLSVTGNQAGMTQPVYIIGTDWADNAITDKITLNGTSSVGGVKPFKTVTTIILPAQGGLGETVSVGRTSKLGLYFPISATSDVLQQGRKASGANSYTLESIGTPDATYASVDVGTISGNDSFEWAVLASQ